MVIILFLCEIMLLYLRLMVLVEILLGNRMVFINDFFLKLNLKFDLFISMMFDIFFVFNGMIEMIFFYDKIVYLIDEIISSFF